MPLAQLPPTFTARAQDAYQNYAERAAAAGLDAVPLKDLPGDAARVLACSEFVATEITRQPALLEDLLNSGDLERDYDSGTAATAAAPHQRFELPASSPSATVIERFAQQLWPEHSCDAPDHPAEPLEEDEVMQRLRRARKREWVRLAWRDLGGLCDTPTLIAEASAFADAAVRFALHHAHLRLAQRLGNPLTATGEVQELVVLALGKLGAGELNFSSDIDLIFFYPRAGETQGGRRSLSNNEFFLRLARLLIKYLTQMTSDGSVFRVDMRLRPFGDSGPLVMSFDAMEEYYQAHGRDWERYALIRARPLSGSAAARAEIDRRLQPFVYRRYLDFGTLELLRDMKRNMSEEVERRGLHNNVKLGGGGIREVEFTAQAFQMVRGGRTKALRERCLLRVLPVLGNLELLPAFVIKDLATAYCFLRTVEHRLQEAQDRQVHELPDGAEEQLLLAVGMGYSDWDALAEDLSHHRARVHEQFTQVFGTEEEETQRVDDPLDVVMAPELPAEAGMQLLAEGGFEDSESAWNALQRFKQTNDVRLVDGMGARRLQTLLPDLLRAVANQDDALTTLDRVLGIIQSIVRRSAYLSLLSERPLGLSQLVKLCAASPWIARQLARHPILLDELLDSRHLYVTMTREELERDLAQRLECVNEGDTEQELEVLRQFKHAAVLRVAASDLGQALPLMRVSDHLTEIAEVLVNQALAYAWRDLVARHGEPCYEEGGERKVAPFAIIAYGKLGGIELGYGSDLDLVFVHGGPANVQTDGRRPLDAVVFFQRLGQRIIHVLSTPTAGGVLYEVDARLRPSGNKGPLVVRTSALADYLRKEAWTWEHQALVRARVIAGDRSLAAQFEALREEVLEFDRDPAELRKEVRDMRERMRAAKGSQGSDTFDLKQDAGGIADIEFMVQYCALRWAKELGDWARFTDNIRLLEGLAETGLMPSEQAQRLTDIYRNIRAAVHRQALQEQPGVVSTGEFDEERSQVKTIWQELMES